MGILTDSTRIDTIRVLNEANSVQADDFILLQRGLTSYKIKRVNFLTEINSNIIPLTSIIHQPEYSIIGRSGPGTGPVGTITSPPNTILGRENGVLSFTKIKNSMIDAGEINPSKLGGGSITESVHGNLASGTTAYPAHAIASTTTPGFMSAQDKTDLENVKQSGITILDTPISVYFDDTAVDGLTGVSPNELPVWATVAIVDLSMVSSIDFKWSSIETALDSNGPWRTAIGIYERFTSKRPRPSGLKTQSLVPLANGVFWWRIMGGSTGTNITDGDISITIIGYM